MGLTFRKAVFGFKNESKIKQMDEDSDGAINGSSNVIKIGQDLTDKVIEISAISDNNYIE